MLAVTRPGGAGVRVKFCGLRDVRDVEAAAAAGAAYAGLVLYPPSPRAVTIEAARALALAAPMGLARVALLVDPDDALLDAVAARLPVDFVQLHGDESPARVAEARARTGLPVIRAVGLRDRADLPALAAAEAVADMVLVDAKPPRGAALPGGNGAAFDWTLLAGRAWRKPWMLAGGLTAANVAEAVLLTGARQVDVSSGVESAPGRKEAGLIAAFATALRGAAA